MDRVPRVVPPSALVEPPAQQTPGIRRREAFASDERWIGLVETTPGEWSGWHHHGATDSYFFVMQGSIEFEHGPERTPLRVGAGEFALMPSGVVHRERTAPGDPVKAIVVRLGPGPTVINVDAP